MAIAYRAGYHEMDFDRVHAMLTTARWSRGASKEEVLKAAQNSGFCAGAFDEAGRQVAYARVLTDKTRFAYIADVFVEEAFRGQGIGKALIRFILAHEELGDVYQWMLITRSKTARHVYESCGFAPIKEPALWMQIWGPRPTE